MLMKNRGSINRDMCSLMGMPHAVNMVFVIFMINVQERQGIPALLRGLSPAYIQSP
jgi:hypothetical protein